MHLRTGTEFCRDDAARYPLELFYTNGDTLSQDKGQRVTVKLLSALAARVILDGDHSSRELFIHLDPETGDLCVRPSGQSARRGLVSVRWNLPFAGEAALILPCVNGTLVETHRPFPPSHRFPWPFRWNAQLAIAERDGVSFMIHSQDTGYRFKALNLAREENGLSTLGFESEHLGPLADNRNAGGVTWRLNAYDGGWQQPATRYRAWMESAYQLAAKRATRPSWVKDITFSVQWAPADPAYLDALAKIHPPAQTLIHLSHDWRTHHYDVYYPDFTPNERARPFLDKANAMGFKVLPHFNYWGCYDGHPLYQKVRDWQVRDPYTNAPILYQLTLDDFKTFGSHYVHPVFTEFRALGVPDEQVLSRMPYMHAGLSAWRRALIDEVLAACAALGAPGAFLDQTLWTANTDNGLVENMTTAEGLHQLQEELAAIWPDVVLEGEGLHEIAFQRQCFAQAHIHDGWDFLSPHHIDAAHSIGAFLWQGHTRLVGYYHLNPADRDIDIGIEVYRRLGALPTLIVTDPAHIHPEQPVVKRLLELAAET